MEPIRVGIVGTGNYAWHLIQCFKANSLSIDVHFGRSTESFEGFIHPPETKQTHSLDDLSNCDLLFLCISDSSIKSLSNYWANHAALVIHVSGGLGITALHSKTKGYFTFPKASLNEEISLISDCPFVLKPIRMKIRANSSNSPKSYSWKSIC